MSGKQIDAIRRSLRIDEPIVEGGAMYATIKSVDADKRTCMVVDDLEMQYDDVLLYAIENADLKGFVALPKVDSVVLVERIGSSNELYVAMTSEIDSVLLTVGDKVTASIDDKELKYSNDKVSLTISGDQVILDAEKIKINGGQNKGLIKIEKLTEKINSMIETFNNHTHSGVIIAVSGGSGSPAVGAPGNTAVPASLAQKLNTSDYQNDKITH